MPRALTYTRITWTLSPMAPQVPGVTSRVPLVPMVFQAILIGRCATLFHGHNSWLMCEVALSDHRPNCYNKMNKENKKKQRKNNACTLYQHECEPITQMRNMTSRVVAWGVWSEFFGHSRSEWGYFPILITFIRQWAVGVHSQTRKRAIVAHKQLRQANRIVTSFGGKEEPAIVWGMLFALCQILHSLAKVLAIDVGALPLSDWVGYRQDRVWS